MTPHVVEADELCRVLTTQRQFLERCGTGNQLERHLAGLLPEDELLSLVRHVLFGPFAEYRRWVKLSPADLMHRRGCHGSVVFTTHPAPDLMADEWEKYKAIRDAVHDVNERVLLPVHGVSAKVELVEHVGVCESCGNDCSAVAASIRIEWAGRPLSREYSLEDIR